MGYFGYLAKQSFGTSPDGERLFMASYVIPDAATEEILFKKQVLLLRIVLGLAFLLVLAPHFFNRGLLTAPVYLIVALVLAILVSWIGHRLMFRSLLGTLPRVQKPLGRMAAMRERFEQQSTGGLVLGFLASLVFVAIGVWMVKREGPLLVAWLCILFFGIGALAWGYGLYCKLTRVKSVN